MCVCTCVCVTEYVYVLKCALVPQDVKIERKQHIIDS